MVVGAGKLTGTQWHDRTEPRPTGEQISVLEMLAGCPGGCPEAVLKASGFTIGLLGKLIRAGLATATPGIVEAGGRTLGVVRLAITEKGRTMIVR
jgi:hypothetical protein